MTAPNRADLINATYRVLKKHYQSVEPPENRPVLEHLLYACCLENNPFDKVDASFERIKSQSFDWNEVRVTSVAELAEWMVGFSDPRRTAASLRQLLQSVFETHYSFDLEHLRKQNLGKTIKDLEKHQGATSFVVSYVTQHALAGHAIPLDRGALDAMFIIGVLDEKERQRDSVPGLERTIPKKSGVEFGALLHHLAADLVANPFSPQVRALLQEINPDCKDRLPKRQVKKKPLSGADAPETDADPPKGKEVSAAKTASVAKPSEAASGAKKKKDAKASEAKASEGKPSDAKAGSAKAGAAKEGAGKEDAVKESAAKDKESAATAAEAKKPAVKAPAKEKSPPEKPAAKSSGSKAAVEKPPASKAAPAKSGGPKDAAGSKEAATSKDAAGSKEKAASDKSASKKSPVDKPPAKKVPPKAEDGGKSAAKSAKKKPVAAESKRSASKQLTKKKPR